MNRRTAVSALLLFSLAAQAPAAPRDVQFRTIDFTTNVVELFNFGDAAEPLDGWRFCTHDDNEFRRYSGFSGLNGVSIGAGESLFLHFDNDATEANEISVALLGGAFAGPLDRGPYGLGLYINSGFSSGANLADHVQWSIDGVDNATADERSDEAEGEVWTDQSLWVPTTASTLRLELTDLTGGELHGPGDYAVIEPISGDFDGDGDVDVDDFGVFVASFQNSPQGGPPFADGDFDEDGDVDIDDFGVFVNSFQTFPPASGVAVPEPAGAVLIGLALVAGGRFQRGFRPR